MKASPRIDRTTTQQIFIRVCRDSGFQLDMHRAAMLAAKVIGCHPLDIWMALPSLDVMYEIAAGTYPAAIAQPPSGPPLMNPPIAEVAEGLSRGEARAIMAADEAGILPTYYPRIRPAGRQRIMYPTLCNLNRAGLIVFHPPRLTRRGLAVRAHLEESK